MRSFSRFLFILSLCFLAIFPGTPVRAQESDGDLQVNSRDDNLVARPRPTSVVGVYIDEEGMRRAQERMDETTRELGYEPQPAQGPQADVRDPAIPDAFELPSDQEVGGCMYPRGSSFPDFCFDDDGQKIFEAGLDPQSPLDAIRASHGITGEYNIVPPGYKAHPAAEEDDSIIVIPGEKKPGQEVDVP